MLQHLERLVEVRGVVTQPDQVLGLQFLRLLVAARGLRHQLQGRQRAGQVTTGSPQPGQAETGRGDVVGVVAAQLR